MNITLNLSEDEKNLLEKVLYREYMRCPDTPTMEKCQSVLKKIGFKFPSQFDWLIDKNGKRGYDC